MGRKLGGKNKISKRIEIKCDYCEKRYLTYPYRLKRGDKHKYCSYGCMGLATKGRKCREETREKLSLHMRRLWEKGILKSKKAWNKGTKGIMKAWNRGLIGYKAGKKHYNWQGGISFEPYTPEFNGQLKESIKKRDNDTCRLYGENKGLAIHHIDYNKKNNNEDNLITLCRSCNSIVNFNRLYWINFFKVQIYELYQQGSYSKLFINEY